MPLPAIALALALLLAAASSVAALNNYESERWMSQNAENSDVVVLPSGLQYKILEKGSGTDSPTADSPCLCHYEGTLIDGTKFDSSYDRGEPTTFAPNQVIAGWTEALQFMVEGDKLQLFIPSDLAYGDRGSPPKINAGDALIFTIELIITNASEEIVISMSTHDNIITLITIELIIARSSHELVITSSTQDEVISLSTRDDFTLLCPLKNI